MSEIDSYCSETSDNDQVDPNYPFNYEKFEVKPTKKGTFSNASTRKCSADSTTDVKIKFKTEVCKYWSLQVNCPFGEICSFAHGEEQKRFKEKIPQKYKTRKCKNFDIDGFCSYGIRCQFIHNHYMGKKYLSYKDLLAQIEHNSENFFGYQVRDDKDQPETGPVRLNYFKYLSSGAKENGLEFESGIAYNCLLSTKKQYKSF